MVVLGELLLVQAELATVSRPRTSRICHSTHIARHKRVRETVGSTKTINHLSSKHPVHALHIPGQYIRLSSSLRHWSDQSLDLESGAFVAIFQFRDEQSPHPTARTYFTLEPIPVYIGVESHV